MVLKLETLGVSLILRERQSLRAALVQQRSLRRLVSSS
jgi:hypothetical protein